MKDWHVASWTLAVTMLLMCVTTPAWAVYTDQQLRKRFRQAVIDHHLYVRPDCMEYFITRKA